MSNLLKVAMIETILSLRQRGWSQRRIARELGIDRETVARHLRQPPAPPKPALAPIGSSDTDEESKPARAPTGSAVLDGESKPAIVPTGSADAGAASPPGAEGRQAAGRPSECAPWRDAIQAKLALGLSAQRIHQDLAAEHGFTGSYYSVRRFVRHLEETHELPFRRLECSPGEEAQVDFGSGAALVGADGKRRRTHVFRIILSHSRKGYSEAVLRQTTDDFQPQGARVRPALRHHPAAHPALHATPQGQGGTRRRLRPGECAQRPDVRRPGRAESLPARLGTDRGRHAPPRHYPPPGRHTLPECGTARLATLTPGAVPLLPGGATGRPSGRSRRGRTRLLLGAT